MSIHDVIIDQVKLYDKIKDYYAKFINIHKTNVSIGLIESRLTLMPSFWKNYQENDEKIFALKTEKNENQEYFTNEAFRLDNVEGKYFDEVGKFLEFKRKLLRDEQLESTLAIPQVSGILSNPVTGPPAVRHKLPTIPVPKFNGNYKEWLSFKNLFNDLVIKTQLSDSEKLALLKDALSEEPLYLIQNITVTEGHFQDEIWGKLLDHYDNNKVIMYSHVNSLLNLKKMSEESSTQLRRLVNQAVSNVNSLKALRVPVEQWNVILVPIITNCLDQTTRKEWESFTGDSSDPSSYDDLIKFLNKRLRTLEAWDSSSKAQGIKSKSAPSQGRKIISTNQVSNPKVSSSDKLSCAVKCFFCTGAHSIYLCDSFRKLSVPERFDYVKSSKLCFNCLAKHSIKDCKSQRTCSSCQKKHHSLLHDSSRGSTQSSVPTAISENASNSSFGIDQTTITASYVSTPAAHSVSAATVLLGTAIVGIESSKGQLSYARALIDPGSEVSFAAESLVQRLKLQRSHISIPISGVGTVKSTTRGSTELLVRSRINTEFVCKVNVFILSKLTSYVPKCKKVTSDWSYISNLSLADPHFSSDATIELILGADVYSLIIQRGLETGAPDDPVAQNTALGWILICSTGSAERSSISSQHLSLCIENQLTLDKAIQQFWDVEAVPVPSSKVLMSNEDRLAEQHFLDTYSRDDSGRFVLRLPFKTNSYNFSNSYSSAKQSFLRLEAKLKLDPELNSSYAKFMSEYQSLSHMQSIPDLEINSFDSYFIPHHGIFQGEKKLRVVFNASARYGKGTSLNNVLHVGPALQTNVAVVISRWRFCQFAYIADIEKMYRQILIHPLDRKFQRIIWRSSPSEILNAFDLCTVTYGVASSAFQAIRSLRQLAIEEASKFPLASTVILDNMYVDDALFGSDTIEGAVSLAKDVSKLLMAGGFPLKKWMANHPDLLDHIPKDFLVSDGDLRELLDSKHKLLGMFWVPTQDSLHFSLNVNCSFQEVTKRQVLSTIAKLYDPLGLLAPVTVRCKIFMQHLWLEKLQWDDVLSKSLSDQWMSIYKDLVSISQVKVNRWLEYVPGCVFELHGFGDASKDAISALVYLRVLYSDRCVVNLLISKTKVSPIKTLTTARLELCASTMLCKLVNSVLESLNLSPVAIHLWSDSKVTLAWINSSPHLWNVFVSHRVAEIQRLMPNAHWHYIEGLLNPADISTRGKTSKELCESTVWWHGPDCIKNNNNLYECSSPEFFDSKCLEEKRKTCHVVQKSTRSYWDALYLYSSYSKLVRITAWCLRYVLNRHYKKIGKPLYRPEHLQAHELKYAEICLTRHTQMIDFPQEYYKLSKGTPISRKSSLLNLNVFFDQTVRCLRVNGRIRHAKLSPDERFPYVISPNSPLAHLIVKSRHLKSLHGGTQLTLSLLRDSHWLINGRRFVKSFISKCLTCVRYRASPMQQQMAPLPYARVNPSPPFSHVGVDYAGPFKIKMSSGRGYKATKGYIAIFVCLCTKAVHIEAVTGYDTANFLNAFKRFTSRRGLCSHVYSDCGTNFVGADSQLKLMFSRSSSQISKIINNLSQSGIQWHFNPPGAPHFGGMWEAAVRSAKFHMKRVIGDTTLSYEEMSTLLASIEACLNSRPLSPLTDDISDFQFLTPGHFLIGRPLLTLLDCSDTNPNFSLLNRWNLITKLRDDFWARWRQSYLQGLQPRQKWLQPSPNLTVGSMVLIKYDITPPAQWPIARVIKVHPGSDGLIRVATVKTATSEFQRPVAKLILLPIDVN